jgi:hypothetical protein
MTNQFILKIFITNVISSRMKGIGCDKVGEVGVQSIKDRGDQFFIRDGITCSTKLAMCFAACTKSEQDLDPCDKP